MNSVMPKCKTSPDTSTDKIMKEFCISFNQEGHSRFKQIKLLLIQKAHRFTFWSNWYCVALNMLS